MLINRVGATSFKRIQVWCDNFNEREKAIKQDIIAKLHEPYPNDMKKRNCVDYLEEEKNMIFLFQKTIIILM